MHAPRGVMFVKLVNVFKVRFSFAFGYDFLVGPDTEIRWLKHGQGALNLCRM